MNSATYLKLEWKRDDGVTSKGFFRDYGEALRFIHKRGLVAYRLMLKTSTVLVEVS